MNCRDKTQLIDFPYIKTFLRDLLLSAKFISDEIVELDALAIRFFNFRTEE